MTTALFIGRFQPFHSAHLNDVKKILKSFDKMIIGIGSSQEKRTKKNPFSFKERKKMIEETLKNLKIKNFKIFPIPDFYNDVKWIDYIKKYLPKFDCVYSGNEWTLKCFRKHGMKTRKIKLEKGTSSTKIREMIAKNEKWEKIVPKEVCKYIEEIYLKRKINSK